MTLVRAEDATIRILVVDDEEEIREMLSRHFRYLGYDVDTAENGQEGLERLRSTNAEIVISDIKMPVMDGIELLKAVREESPMTHVIMITGYVTLHNALTCMRRGADTFVLKPLEDLGELEHAVQGAACSIRRWWELLRTLQKLRTVSEGIA